MPKRLLPANTNWTCGTIVEHNSFFFSKKLQIALHVCVFMTLKCALSKLLASHRVFMNTLCSCTRCWNIFIYFMYCSLIWPYQNIFESTHEGRIQILNLSKSNNKILYKHSIKSEIPNTNTSKIPKRKIYILLSLVLVELLWNYSLYSRVIIIYNHTLCMLNLFLNI